MHAFLFIVIIFIGTVSIPFIILDISREAEKNKSIDNPNNQSNQPIQSSFKKEILCYYKKFDLIYNKPPGKVGGKVGDPSNLSLDESKVVYTFLGLSSKGKAVVFEGELESKSEIQEKIHCVKKISVEKLLGYTNLHARIRKRKVEGAKAYCDLKNSDVEKERQKKFHEKVEFESLEALPCGIVEETKNKIGRRKLPES